MRSVRGRGAEEFIKQAEEIRKRSRRVKENLSARIIREDRDSR